LLAGFRPGLVTTRLPRAVRSRRSQISTAIGTSPRPSSRSSPRSTENSAKTRERYWLGRWSRWTAITLDSRSPSAQVGSSSCVRTSPPVPNDTQTVVSGWCRTEGVAIFRHDQAASGARVTW